MRNSHEKDHNALRVLAPEPIDSDASPAKRDAKIGLSWLDKLGLGRLVETDDVDPVYKWVADSASALAGGDREAARNRLLARLIAETRATHALLEALLVERLRDRDHNGVGLVQKALSGCHCRLLSLLSEHRISTAGERRAGVVAIAHADNVSFAGK